jgi:hypothetical protein
MLQNRQKPGLMANTNNMKSLLTIRTKRVTNTNELLNQKKNHYFDFLGEEQSELALAAFRKRSSEN